MPSNPATQELLGLVFHGREERNLEYKASLNWGDPTTKAKIAKAAMAMANLQDGGAIVIGVNKAGNAYDPQGMTEADAVSFSQDDVLKGVNEYADPYVELTVFHTSSDDSRRFVVIQVRAFDQLPVVCKKEGPENLRRGAVYTRSRRTIETTEVGSQSEMREIIERAVDIQIDQLERRGLIYRVSPRPTVSQSEEYYREERGGL